VGYRSDESRHPAGPPRARAEGRGAADERAEGSPIARETGLSRSAVGRTLQRIEAEGLAAAVGIDPDKLEHHRQLWYGDDDSPEAAAERARARAEIDAGLAAADSGARRVWGD
jgi:hypothetical protein